MDSMMNTIRVTKARLDAQARRSMKAVPVELLYELIETLVADPECLRTATPELLSLVANIATLPIVDYLIDVEERNSKARMN